MNGVPYDGQVIVRALITQVELRVLYSCLLERGQWKGVLGIPAPEGGTGVRDVIDVEAGLLQGHCVLDEAPNPRGEVCRVVRAGEDALGREGEILLVEGGVACLCVLAANVIKKRKIQFEKVLPVFCEGQHRDWYFVLSVALSHFCKCWYL